MGEATGNLGDHGVETADLGEVGVVLFVEAPDSELSALVLTPDVDLVVLHLALELLGSTSVIHTFCLAIILDHFLICVVSFRMVALNLVLDGDMFRNVGSVRRLALRLLSDAYFP